MPILVDQGHGARSILLVGRPVLWNGTMVMTAERKLCKCIRYTEVMAVGYHNDEGVLDLHGW